MDRKRYSEKRAKTSEGKTTILQAEFDEFGIRVPDEVGSIACNFICRCPWI